MSTLPTPNQDPTTALLRRFQVSRDAFAFREIVQHYGGLVQGTARRLLHGDDEAAQDVAQRVFMDLAQAAAKLAPDSQLGGWLHRHTVFLASNHGVADQRRRRREREAASRMELDRTETADMDPDRAAEVHIALAKLPEEDRTALVLRYWENRSLREVGTAFGIGEDAAQKRVSRALDRVRNRLGAGTGALGVTALAQCLTLAPEAQAAVPAWISTVVGTSLDPALTSTPGSLKFAGTFKTGMLGAGLAAGVCWAVFIPEINRLKQDLASVRADATPSTAALVSTPPLSSAKPEQITVSNPALEQRIRQLEARLESKTAREQMVVANLKRARDRADRDRQTFSADDLTELESAYQLAKQEADPARHAAALRPLLEKFGSSNRAGCAVLRLARLTTGPDRERWLQEAIVNHSDTYYLDGTSVGAMARLQLAAEWAHAGRQPGAAQLRQEIEDLFPDATDHDGLPVLESLRGSTRPD